MHGKKHNWLYGILASLITLAILFGGQMLFNKYAMARPMDKMFEQMEGVECFEVSFAETEANGGRGKIRIKLSGVKNLQVLYGQIITGLDKYGGAKKYDITISDNRDTQLEDFYYQIHYFVEDARDNSNFALMSEKIQKKAATAGIRSKIYVDASYIYLQLEKEKDADADADAEKELEKEHNPGIMSEKSSQDSQMYVVLPRKRASQEAR